HIAASILVTGTLTFQIIALGFASSSLIEDFRGLNRQLLRLAFGALVAALVSAFVWYWLEVVNMSGSSLIDSFFCYAWRAVLFQTKFGRVWLVRFGVIALLFALTGFCFGGDKPRRACEFVAWLLSVVLLVSLVWISHAAAASTQPLGAFGDAVHLYAAAAWIGGVLPLAVFLRRAHLSLSF